MVKAQFSALCLEKFNGFFYIIVPSKLVTITCFIFTGLVLVFRAVDLMVLFDGFKPTGGSIKKVTIYPSDFGVKRLAEENRFGPAELLQDDDDYSDDKDTARYEYYWRYCTFYEIQHRKECVVISLHKPLE